MAELDHVESNKAKEVEVVDVVPILVDEVEDLATQNMIQNKSVNLSFLVTAVERMVIKLIFYILIIDIRFGIEEVLVMLPPVFERLEFALGQQLVFDAATLRDIGVPPHVSERQRLLDAWKLAAALDATRHL